MPETMQVYISHAQTAYPESTVSLVVRVTADVDPLSLVPPCASDVRDRSRSSR